MLKKYNFLSLFLIIFLSFFVKETYSQIKVFERPLVKDTVNKGLFWESDKRIKIDLNGKWNVSFDDGLNYSNISVPSAYKYNGTALFKKDFKVSDSLLKYFCFLLVAEGINYESEVKINNIFITRHFGGFDSYILPLDENVIKNDNEIFVKIESKLDNSSTIPLANQINYSDNYGGINKDIYIIAVPKIFIFFTKFSYQFESDNSVRITNVIDVNSENLSNLKTESKDFTIKTLVIRKSTGETAAESSTGKINIVDYQTQNITNEFILKNPLLWSADSPELYLIKTIIYSQDKIIDYKIFESGFSNIKLRPDNMMVNGKPVKINGINYYEDQPKSGSALDYFETEKDLLKIKDYGFNCIRVPGRSAHPYIINICNRIGLFLLQEIPFNEVPEITLSSRKYIQDAEEYMESNIKRDMSSPCIVAWGIGNNFDVSCKPAVAYVKLMKNNISALDSRRPMYYTTKNIKDDICQEFADFEGINFSTRNYEKIQENVNEIRAGNRNNRIIFAASYGICVTNDNRNGFGDLFSIEAQSKLLSESHKTFTDSFFGNFVSSFADWNSCLPLNFPQSVNQYLKTDGIFDYYREPKFSAGILKRINYNQSFQKIPEGSGEKRYTDLNYIFIIFGITVIIIFISLLSKLRYFKENRLKSIITPKNFTMFIKEQIVISSTRNLILSLLIASSIALYFSSLIYYLRSNILFDMIIANTISNSTGKMIFSDIANSPLKILSLTILISLAFLHLIGGIVFLLNRFSYRKVYFRTVYTATIWSFIPMLIFLPVGMIFYKLISSNTEYISWSIILFAVLLLYSLVKLISSIRIIFETPALKTYIYGILTLIFFTGGFYVYFNFIHSTIRIINLILSYRI